MKLSNAQSNTNTVSIETTDPDLPMDDTGKIYHLDCHEENLADNIILVGDPGRVPTVAAYFDEHSIEFNNMHREIRIITGTYKNVRVSCISTGMGTDNIEIVINEIHALKECSVDATTKAKTWRYSDGAQTPNLRLVRVGTCGSPNVDAEVGMLAITQNVIGMDNTCRYYKRPALTPTDRAIRAALDRTVFGERIRPYTGHADAELAAQLQKATRNLKSKRKALTGITCSGSGFYGCQGRQTGRFELGVPSLISDLGGLEVPTVDGGDALKVVNIEMECSALCVLSDILGYRASAICAILATRVGDNRTFATPDVAKAAVHDGITAALEVVTGQVSAETTVAPPKGIRVELTSDESGEEKEDEKEE